ncbi:hypothetical protein H0H87_001748, partial [Tephrocybe sp. NHM501043]
GFWRAMEEGEEWTWVEDGASCGLEQQGKEKEKKANGKKVRDNMDIDVLEQEHDKPESEDEEAYKIPVEPSLQLLRPKCKSLLVPMEVEELILVDEQPALLSSPFCPPPMLPEPEMEEPPVPAPAPAARTPTPVSARFRMLPPPAHFPMPPPPAHSSMPLPLAQFPMPPPPLACSPTPLPSACSPTPPAPACSHTPPPTKQATPPPQPKVKMTLHDYALHQKKERETREVVEWMQWKAVLRSFVSA